jgi:hypothetical protein
LGDDGSRGRRAVGRRVGLRWWDWSVEPCGAFCGEAVRVRRGGVRGGVVVRDVAGSVRVTFAVLGGLPR